MFVCSRLKELVGLEKWDRGRLRRKVYVFGFPCRCCRRCEGLWSHGDDVVDWGLRAWF